MPYETAQDRILREITDDIRAGRLAPGDRLPSIREIACRYEVSEMPVRQALRILRERGLTYVVSGVGTFVADDATGR